MLTRNSFTSAEKREAVDKVLNSETFARSEQLRHFLKFVCDMEIEGRAAEINEYMIGVDVLRRPEGYSPGNDSSVRSRAHELRNRLKKYYETKSPNGPIRIDIPKGSYAPIFVDSSTPDSGSAQESVEEAHAEQSHRKARYRPLVVAFAGGALTVLALGSLWIGSRAGAPIDPALREAWGPLLQPAANVLVCVGSTLHMVVRPRWQEIPGGPSKFDALPELYSLLRIPRDVDQRSERMSITIPK